MNKKQLVDEVCARTGVKKDVAATVINALFDTVADTLRAGDDVTIVGFGTFDTRHSAPRTIVNPHTKQPMDIPARHHPRLRFSKTVEAEIDAALQKKAPEPQ